jgi:hypothetical protein
MGGSMWSTFWRMAAAIVQHAADRELFIAGELAAVNGPHKIGISIETRMSALGHKRTFSEAYSMSALSPKADIIW